MLFLNKVFINIDKNKMKDITDHTILNTDMLYNFFICYTEYYEWRNDYPKKN